ncbi:sigma-70 family RNA polymerase sigma factor [Paenibacillus eucommiae]|uniref:RNA polymerase sigma-70 factor (ECF subfamily) n=1 Tax=Paenibacillus eucommiae TaxID=1355755 RepID=A0ABS4JAK6_9BACL|nr:sigma-70 family RNA polymerase sigma factor [Paenibacillus eucommiae]MBP1996877.1 RNA polymerase sigma-70 factor (ECF subfamily) [Paenibacillus eucommiae]
MEPDGLDSIYRMYMKDVYRYLRSLCRDHQEAEDLVQETFYRAYLYLENCRDDKVKPWLFRVAYNVFVDLKRKQRRSVTKEGGYFNQLSDAADTPESKLLREERMNEIERAVASLPDNQRQAMLLYDFHQFSYQEAAEIMEVGLSHFKILLFRARQRLRQQKERSDQDERGV